MQKTCDKRGEAGRGTSIQGAAIWLKPLHAFRIHGQRVLCGAGGREPPQPIAHVYDKE